MNGRWVCSDVWMDTFPFFDRPQLGLKLALISDRFDILVDTHFDGKRELTIWRAIEICKDKRMSKPSAAVMTNYANSVPFPLPDRPLPNKIRFKDLVIFCIDHSVIAFLRSNQQIWDKGTNLRLWISSSLITDHQPIWEIFVLEIWPIFSKNIRLLRLFDVDHLDNLCRHISSTILTDCNQLNSIDSGRLLPDVTDDFDGPNATPTAGQILSKWLHTPRKDGQPKELNCCVHKSEVIQWVNNFKEKFLCATTLADYKIQFNFPPQSMALVPFELVNDQTQEKLTLKKASKDSNDRWIMNRCQIGETAAIQWEDKNWDDLSTIHFMIYGNNCIGPLSPPTPPAAEEKAGQSSEKIEK